MLKCPDWVYLINSLNTVANNNFTNYVVMTKRPFTTKFAAY